MVQPEDLDTLKRYQDDQAVSKDIVVQRAQELGRKEWKKAALTEKRKLIGS